MISENAFEKGRSFRFKIENTEIFEHFIDFSNIHKTLPCFLAKFRFFVYQEKVNKRGHRTPPLASVGKFPCRHFFMIVV